MTRPLATDLRIEPTQHKSHGRCPHCGGEEQTVWGNVYAGGQQRAVYYVRWTAGRRRENVTFLVSVGTWTGAAPGWWNFGLLEALRALGRVPGLTRR